jgi:ABC-type bacteriocin/lantibiotic exporter with double-glycine peptidase domain
MVRRILQEDTTGCGLACVAMVTGSTYAKVKAAAIRLGIAARGEPCYTVANDLARLMREFGMHPSKEKMITSWPPLKHPSIVAINLQKNGNWHWVVYVPGDDGGHVFDPKKSIKTVRRTDFSRMRPRSYIPMRGAAA